MGSGGFTGVDSLRVTALRQSFQARLLILIGLLSVPLLVVSLAQLHTFRTTIEDQTERLVTLKATAAAARLETWVARRSRGSPASALISNSEATELFKYLEASGSGDSGSILVVITPSGQALANPTLKNEPRLITRISTESTELEWSDGVKRATHVTEVRSTGWKIVAGIPSIKDTIAGRMLLRLAVTYVFVLTVSIFLGVWAVDRLTKPLRELAKSITVVKGLPAGNLSASDDEIGRVAKGLNVITAELEERFQEVRSQSAFIEDVLNSLPFGVLVVGEGMNIKQANSTLEKKAGFKPGSLSNQNLYESFPGLRVLREAIHAVHETRRPFVTYGVSLDLADEHANDEKVESSFYDVTVWPVSEPGETSGDLILVLAEVSDRVRAERMATTAFSAERRRAAELESTISQMNEGVILVDGSGHVKMNPAAARILGSVRSDGYDSSALLNGARLYDLSGRPLDPEELPLRRVARQREVISGEQFKLLANDGETRFIAFSGAPLSLDRSEKLGAVAVFRDITENVKQHEELVLAYDRLCEHDRLKTAFVSSITHELRTPLNVIIGLCQSLERDPQMPLAAIQIETVKRMERNARSLLDLVNDLLEYSRLEAGRAALNLEPVDVGELVEEIAGDLAVELRRKKVDLRTTVSEGLDSVITDRHKLRQVVSNLVGNAVKFTTYGSITVSAGLVDDERWWLEVRDTGIGMSEEASGYIFEEFRQVDDRLARVYGGAGLGLAITKKTVEVLGGEISVESRLNEGSAFHMTWPLIARQRTGTGSLVASAQPKQTVEKFQSDSVRSRSASSF